MSYELSVQIPIREIYGKSRQKAKMGILKVFISRLWSPYTDPAYHLVNTRIKSRNLVEKGHKMKILPLLLFTETLAYRRPYNQPVYNQPSMDFNRPQVDYSKLPKRSPIVWEGPSSNEDSYSQGKNQFCFQERTKNLRHILAKRFSSIKFSQGRWKSCEKSRQGWTQRWTQRAGKRGG